MDARCPPMLGNNHSGNGECSSSTSVIQQNVEDDRVIAVVLSEEYAKLDSSHGQRFPNLAPVPFQASIKRRRLGVMLVETGPQTRSPCLDDGMDFDTLFVQLCFLFTCSNHLWSKMIPQKITIHLKIINEKHIPRINTYIPNTSDASLDHQRLLQRLNVYDLYEVKVSGDGNCQFRALSDQMYRSPDYHKHVRKEVVKQLKDYRSLYECYVPMKYKHYYRKMSRLGEWGDHVTLQATADKYAAKICLLTSFRDTYFIEILPQNQTPKQEFWLSFWSEVHYNSLYEMKDAPVPCMPRRKHWLL